MFKPTIDLLTFDDIKKLKSGDKEFCLSPFLVAISCDISDNPSSDLFAFRKGLLPFVFRGNYSSRYRGDYKKEWDVAVYEVSGKSIIVPFFSRYKKDAGIYDYMDDSFSLLGKDEKERKSFYPRVCLEYGILNWNKEWNDKDEVELGLFPQNLLTYEELDDILEKDNSGKLVYVNYKLFGETLNPLQKLEKTSYGYVSSDTKSRYNSYYDIDYSICIDPETEKKYLKIGNTFVELKPIKWIVDKENKKLIQKDAIYREYTYDNIKDLFHDIITDIFDKDLEGVLDKALAKYRTEHSKKDTILDKYNEKEEVKEEVTREKAPNPKTQGVKELIDEITKLIPHYYGDLDVKEYVNKLIDDYNSKIRELNSRNNQMVLTLETDNREILYTNLLYELNSVLDKLRKTSEYTKDYREMLDRIKNAKLSVDEMDKDKDDISSDIYIIKKNIFPFLRDEQMEDKLYEILTDEEIMLLNKLKALSNVADKTKEEFKNLSELKKDFALKMKSYLYDLNDKVNKKNLVAEINDSYAKIGMDKYRTEKDSTITFYLKNLNSLFDEIRRNGNVSDNKKAFEIITKEIRYDDSFEKILDDLSERNIALNRIILDIEERKSNESDLISFDDNESKIVNFNDTTNDTTEDSKSGFYHDLGGIDGL